MICFILFDLGVILQLNGGGWLVDVDRNRQRHMASGPFWCTRLTSWLE
jgi:hypothetical protein